LKDYRAQSPVFSVTLPEDNLVDIKRYLRADGLRRLLAELAPLSAGAHTIHFKAIVTGSPFAGSESEVTYHLTIGR